MEKVAPNSRKYQVHIELLDDADQREKTCSGVLVTDDVESQIAVITASACV